MIRHFALLFRLHPCSKLDDILKHGCSKLDAHHWYILEPIRATRSVKSGIFNECPLHSKSIVKSWLAVTEIC